MSPVAGAVSEPVQLMMVNEIAVIISAGLDRDPNMLSCVVATALGRKYQLVVLPLVGGNAVLYVCSSKTGVIGEVQWNPMVRVPWPNVNRYGGERVPLPQTIEQLFSFARSMFKDEQ